MADVGRRGRTASWTIVGDPAQSSWPDAPEAASARAEALRARRSTSSHLSTNYRNSAEIYAFAADYARRVGLDADLPDAVRRTGEEPRVVSHVPDLEAAVREAVTSTAERVQGTVGIVVPVARRSEVNAWLASWPEHADDAAGARAAVDSTVTPSGEDRIVVLTGLDTKASSSTASWWSPRRRSRTSPPPAAPRSNVVLTPRHAAAHHGRLRRARARARDRAAGPVRPADACATHRDHRLRGDPAGHLWRCRAPAP